MPPPGAGVGKLCQINGLEKVSHETGKRTKMLNELKNNLNAFHAATLANKANSEEKKKYGPVIAEQIKQAIVTDNAEALQWVEAEKESKNPALTAAKSYVSKGFTVGNAIKSGLIVDEGSVSTMYDKIKAAKEEKALKDQALAAKKAEYHRAMKAGADLNGLDFDAWLQAADPLEQSQAYTLGLTIVAEQDKIEQLEHEARIRSERLTEIKAYIDDVAMNDADLFTELQNYVLATMEAQRAA